MMERFHTVIFDFDGTLADSGELVLGIMNTLTPEFGFKPITREEIPALKMMPAWKLLTQRSGIPLWNLFKLRRLERRVREELAKHTEEIEMFAGVPEMIRDLRTAGCEVGIVSSNSPRIVQSVLARAGVEPDFIHAGSTFFGKARAIRKALNMYDIDRSRAVYIGDELRDIEACKKAGIDVIAVGWGFNAADALKAAGAKVVETPQELLSILVATQ
jgi:phosphoglycolate phosphatase